MGEREIKLRPFKPTDWIHKMSDLAEIRRMMEEFERATGFNFEYAEFRSLGNRIITPESLVIQKEDIRGGPLTNLGIIRHMLLGHIVIDPFNPDQLGVNSYDFRMAADFAYRRRTVTESKTELMLKSGRVIYLPDGTGGRTTNLLYNIHEEGNAEFLYGEPEEGKPVKEILSKYAKSEDVDGYIISLPGVPDSSLAFLIPGHETILVVSEEIIGGRTCVVPHMASRSTTRRAGLTVCNDAWLGNVGWLGPWTMELQNTTDGVQIVVAGDPLGQIEFVLTSEDLHPQASYTGQYEIGKQITETRGQIQEIRRSWRPEDMLSGIIRARYPNDNIGYSHLRVQKLEHLN